MMFTTATGTINANTPLVIAADAGATLAFSNTNTTVPATPEELLATYTTSGGTVNGEWGLVGTYLPITIDVTKDTDNQYFYISSNKFWHATGNVNVSPFRAYFKTDTSTIEGNAVKSFNLCFDEEATTINTPESDVTIIGIYNTNGIRLNMPQKGINILYMNDGTTRKIFIK